MTSSYQNSNGATRAGDYWATRQGDELVAAIGEQVDRFVHHLDDTGRTLLLQTQRQAYYGLDADGNWARSSAVQFGGVQGENVMLRSNHFRSLLDHMLVLTTGSRPSFTARAANSDHKSQAQTQLAEGILDYYLSTKSIEDACKRCVALGLRYLEGWLYVGWDAEAGEPVGVTEQPILDEMGEPFVDEFGQPQLEQVPVYEGDVDVRVYEPDDVVRDVSLDSPDDIQWVILHKRVNRWDLAARYPEHADAIQNAPELATQYEQREIIVRPTKMGGELVSTFEFWHDKTPAMPDGRHAIVCGDALLVDVALPFDELPVIPLMPDHEDGTPFGYAGTVDLLPLQEARDAAWSTILTNLDAFGRQAIWAPPGSKFKAGDVAGLTVIESTEAPQVLQMVQLQGEARAVLEGLRTEMEQLSGVNSVARGEPQASLKSGSALALVHSMAMQYNAGIQQAYGQLVQQLGTMLISRLRTFADSRRMAEITGKRGRSYLVEFQGKDLRDVQRVVVEMGSAVLRTSAGRKELADKFFEASLGTSTPMSFDQYIEVMSTGRLDPIFERPRAQRMNIVRENEMLLEGQAPRGLVTDDHQRHIDEHLALLDDPSVRDDDTLSANVLAHVQHHANLWSAMDPILLAATGQQPAPAPAPAAPPPGSVPMGDTGAQPVEVAGATDMPTPPVGAQQANMPTMPDLPPGTDASAVEAAQKGTPIQ